MPIVMMSVGVPGSGKTTYLKSMYQFANNCTYLSADEVRQEMYGDASVQTDPAKVWGVVHRRLQTALSAGQDVVVDGTFVKRADRRALITKCFVQTHSIRPNDQVELLALHFTTPLERCLKWNRQRSRIVPEDAIRRMSSQLERTPPEEWEGFKGVIRIDSSMLYLKEV